MQSSTRSSIKRTAKILGLLLCGAFLLVTSPVWAQEDSLDEETEISHDSSLPVDITSDSLDVDDKTGVFVFRGDVAAKQGGATIYSDRLEVFYTSSNKEIEDGATDDTQNRNIEKIVALGSVKIVQEGRIATGDRAEYLYAEGSVILTGSPRVVQGDNTIAGEKITVYLDGASSTVEGGSSERVKATFVPDDDDSK